MQTLLALAVFRNPTNAMNLLGNALVLVGSSLYTYVRNIEMEASRRASKIEAPVRDVERGQIDEEAI